MATHASILDRYHRKISEKAVLSLDGLLVFLQDKQFISANKAHQIKYNNNDDNRIRIFDLISFLRKQRAEEDVLNGLMGALKYVGNHCLVKELEKEVSLTESERRLKALEAEIQAHHQKRMQLEAKNLEWEKDIEKLAKREEMLKMDKEKYEKEVEELEIQAKKMNLDKEKYKHQLRDLEMQERQLKLEQERWEERNKEVEVTRQFLELSKQQMLKQNEILKIEREKVEKELKETQQSVSQLKIHIEELTAEKETLEHEVQEQEKEKSNLQIQKETLTFAVKAEESSIQNLKGTLNKRIAKKRVLEQSLNETASMTQELETNKKSRSELIEENVQLKEVTEENVQLKEKLKKFEEYYKNESKANIEVAEEKQEEDDAVQDVSKTPVLKSKPNIMAKPKLKPKTMPKPKLNPSPLEKLYKRTGINPIGEMNKDESMDTRESGGSDESADESNNRASTSTVAEVSICADVENVMAGPVFTTPSTSGRVGDDAEHTQLQTVDRLSKETYFIGGERLHEEGGNTECADDPQSISKQNICEPGPGGHGTDELVEGSKDYQHLSQSTDAQGSTSPTVQSIANETNIAAQLSTNPGTEKEADESDEGRSRSATEEGSIYDEVAEESEEGTWSTTTAKDITPIYVNLAQVTIDSMATPSTSQVPMQIDQSSNSSTMCGVLFCIGGCDHSGGHVMNSMEVYNKTSAEIKMKKGRAQFGAVAVGDRIYALGGKDESRNDLRSMEILDIPSRKWSEGKPMPNERYAFGVAYLDGNIYAVGGRHDNNALETVDKYNIASRKWTRVAPTHFKRNRTKVVALGRYLFAIGGHDGSHTLSSCEQYDPRGDAWTPIEPMGQGRDGHGVALLDGLAVDLCNWGYGGMWGGALSLCERYTPSTDTWHDIPPMSCGSAGLGVAVLDNKIYAVGGFGRGGTAECYDPKTDKWSGIASLNNGRFAHELVCCDIPDDVLHELRK